MINNITPNFNTQGACTPSASAVNIQIFNPQAYGSGAPQVTTNQTPAWNIPQTTPYPPINTPVYQPLNNVSVQQPQQQTLASQENNILNNPYNAPTGAPGSDTSKSIAGLNSDAKLEAAQNDENKKTEEKKAPKVPLTDDYIKNLENYMNSQDPKVRLMAVKELLERFKEDETRSSDKALNALLNKSIQDPNNTVKFVGLTILDAGYSKGNQETVNILKNIQQDTSSQYGEDSLLASQILLKMSAQQAS